MLKKNARLTAQEVDEVLARGISIRPSAEMGKKPLISMKFLATSAPFRVAAVAPKSLARKATVRNNIRRAVYRALMSLPSPTRGSAVIFVRAIPEKPFTPAFSLQIKALLSKIA